MTRQPSGAASPERLEAIEGLRAYLAFWVVICHAMWASGYQADSLSVLPRLLLDGPLAVNVFIVISAFVIFLLLDRTRISAGQFLIRRFFRLYPLFIALFLVSIPLSIVDLWNVNHAEAYLSPRKLSYLARIIQSGWDNLPWHGALHALMLNGAVPERVVPGAPGAFLDPAWSVSLEWQFYLVAPLAFAWAVSAKWSRWAALAASCLALFAVSLWPPLHVEYGAALPFHVAYFVLGGLCYLFYRWYKRRPGRVSPFLVGGAAAVALLAWGGRDPGTFVPAAIWMAFFGLLLERHDSRPWRVVSPVFTNRIAQYLGRVSYSVYLSHILVQVIVRFVLLRFAPELPRGAHFAILLAVTVAGTIVASDALYRYVEAPGIRLGKLVASRLGSGARVPARRPRLSPSPSVRASAPGA